MLATLLDAGKFPTKGRSQNDKDEVQSWWEDHLQAVRSAYAALAGISHAEWQAVHPGLYIPTYGEVSL